MDEGVIEYRDRGGNEKRRPLPRARDVFDYPESYPEARLPGAQIKTQGTVYWYDRHGQLRHRDRGRDE